MTKPNPIIRVSKRDGETLDWIAERGEVSVSNASIRAQKQYDRLAKRGWLKLTPRTASLTPEGHLARMSAKAQALRKPR
jgi:hypothetical protein